MGISIIKIRWSWDGLIFIMGIRIILRQHLFIEMGPRYLSYHIIVAPDCIMTSFFFNNLGFWISFKWILRKSTKIILANIIPVTIGDLESSQH